jgi:hypothetical protein
MTDMSAQTQRGGDLIFIGDKFPNTLANALTVHIEGNYIMEWPTAVTNPAIIKAVATSTTQGMIYINKA